MYSSSAIAAPIPALGISSPGIVYPTSANTSLYSVGVGGYHSNYPVSSSRPSVGYSSSTPSSNPPPTAPRVTTHVVCETKDTLYAVQYVFKGDFKIACEQHREQEVQGSEVNGLVQVPLLLQAEPPHAKGETGYRVWDCSIILSKFLDKNYKTLLQSCDPSKLLRVLEIGCGMGLSALTIALKGGHALLTDQAFLGPAVQQNINLNSEGIQRSAGKAQFLPLDWKQLEKDGKVIQEELASMAEGEGVGVDIVLAADCVWHHWLIEPFCKALYYTLKHCTRNPSSAHFPVNKSSSFVLTFPCALVAHKLRYDQLGESFFTTLRSPPYEFQMQKVPSEWFHPHFQNTKTDIWVMTLPPSHLSNC
jgi:predicted nicotinamide N-methyase